MSLKKRQQNNGLRKLCTCQRRDWAKCPHSWHFNYKKPYGHHYRLSLDRELRRHVDNKTEAQEEATKIKAAIDAGTFRQASPTSSRGLTLREVATRYLARYVNVPTRRQHPRDSIRGHIERLCAVLGDKPITDVGKGDVEDLRDCLRAEYRRNHDLVTAWRAYQALSADERRGQRVPKRPPPTMRAGVKQGETGINRLLARLRHLFTWAIGEEYTTETPWRRHGVTVIKLEKKAESARTRRLAPGEEEALRAVAGPHLRALMTAELSTGCRVGELLNLQWLHIRYDEQGHPRWIVLQADATKTSASRSIPIGSHLRAELEMRRTDPAGQPHSPQAFVFGNELGERIKSVKTAWAASCRRAGIAGLHFHDLRREFASRLRESGASDHDVRDFLGHANITTTSRYLASTPLRLERALQDLEREQKTGTVASSLHDDGDEANPSTPSKPPN